MLGRYKPLFFLIGLLASLLPLGRVAAQDEDPIAPKAMVVAMWEPEAQVWYDRFEETGLGNLNDVSIPLPGLSMLFPAVKCTSDEQVCLVTVGEGEINAAASMMALILSPKFNLKETYWLFTGIAGVNPRITTLGSVAMARYSVQVALQYEVDPRYLPPNWKSGYFAYGCHQPDHYPTITYGTEVFELNVALREKAFNMARNATLEDEAGPREYRARYFPGESKPSGRPRPPKGPELSRPGFNIEEYRPASEKPSLVKCDSATSDVYYSGTTLSESFEKTVNVWTNGTGEYCMTAQEDNANLEVMVRGDIQSLVDFSRVMVLRSGSNFDRPPPSRSDLEHLTQTDQNGFSIAISNLFNVGAPIIQGIINGWNYEFRRGIPADNYIGDIFGSLGGDPDFGLGSLTGGERVRPGGDGEGSEGGGDEHPRVRRGLMIGRRRGRGR